VKSYFTLFSGIHWSEGGPYRQRIHKQQAAQSTWSQYSRAILTPIATGIKTQLSLGLVWGEEGGNRGWELKIKNYKTVSVFSLCFQEFTEAKKVPAGSGSTRVITSCRWIMIPDPVFSPSRIRIRPKNGKQVRFDLWSPTTSAARCSTTSTARLTQVCEHPANDVNSWAKVCLFCQRAKVHRHVQVPPQHIAVPTRRFSVQGVHASVHNHWLNVPLAWGNSSHRHYNIGLRNWFFQGWVSRFGVPAVITSDRGAQFTSSLWAALCSIQHTPLGGQRRRQHHPRSGRQIVSNSVHDIKGSQKLVYSYINSRSDNRLFS
jgi:hypothetical protein